MEARDSGEPTLSRSNSTKSRRVLIRHLVDLVLPTCRGPDEQDHFTAEVGRDRLQEITFDADYSSGYWRKVATIFQ